MENYKKLTDSIVSNPDDMYVENYKNYKTTIYDKIKIVVGYLNKNGGSDEYELDEYGTCSYCTEEEEEEEQLSEPTKEIEPTLNLSPEPTKEIEPHNFFDYFDEDKSINNVVACSHHEDFNKNGKISEVSCSYIFDKDPHILPDKDCTPFEKYDQEGYQKDKIKYKKQKNINRLGVATLSTIVVMGSAWIHSFINS